MFIDPDILHGTYLAVRTGFEPIQTESKSVMLPLHHLTKHPVFSSHLAQTTVRHRLDFDYRNPLEFLLTGRYHGQTESVVPTGFKPVTSILEGLHSIHLSYGTKKGTLPNN